MQLGFYTGAVLKKKASHRACAFGKKEDGNQELGSCLDVKFKRRSLVLLCFPAATFVQFSLAAALLARQTLADLIFATCGRPKLCSR